MKAVAVLLLAGLALASASALPKSAKTSPLSSYRQTMKAKGIGCDICTLVVTEIDKLIVADQTLDQLIELVEELCSGIDGLFPGAGATCNALVETYLPQIVEGLVNNQLSPASVCATLTLCPWTKKIFILNSIFSKLMKLLFSFLNKNLSL